MIDEYRAWSRRGGLKVRTSRIIKDGMVYNYIAAIRKNGSIIKRYSYGLKEFDKRYGWLTCCYKIGFNGKKELREQFNYYGPK